MTTSLYINSVQSCTNTTLSVLLASEAFTENDHAAEELFYSPCLIKSKDFFLVVDRSYSTYAVMICFFGSFYCFTEMVVLTPVKACFLKRFIHLPLSLFNYILKSTQQKAE